MTPDTPIISHTISSTPDRVAARILARPHGEYTGWDIAGVIVPTYYDTCTAVGIDPVPVIAQMIHETGNLTSFWAARPRRNPAGIGVTGRWAVLQPSTGHWARRGLVWREGVSFSLWTTAITAHVGRLLAYALPMDKGTVEQQRLIDRALSFRPLPPSYRGIAPTWQGLNGRWAVPGTTYAQRVMAIVEGL